VTDVVLSPGRDRSLRRRHPWVLSGAVASVRGEAAPGVLVRVLSAEGETLGFGDLSPRSAIRVRVVHFGKEPPPGDWLRERIAAAVARRVAHPLVGDTDAVRLVNAEGDDLPGFVADRYADVVVVKLGSASMIQRREAIAGALREITGAACGFERSDPSVARQEGVPLREGPLWGDAPAEPVAIRERDRRYHVDVARGQKTGFYLDQRDARDLVAGVARGRRVLDLFSHTGAFAVAAARGGARSAVCVDSSAPALELARRNLEENAPGFDASLFEGDAFEFVRRDEGRYDLLVVDPPPLARKQRDVPRAARAYKDVLLHALRRAEGGALVLAFSCSHHVGAELFRKIVFGAALDAGRSARVLRVLGAAADHPVSLEHPEGEYLCGLLLEL
jgi:23S rRNA (cytosine1962-C5)-methyltransferase